MEDSVKLEELLNTALEKLTYQEEKEADFQVIMNASAILAEISQNKQNNATFTHTCRSEVQAGKKRIVCLFQ